MNNYIICPNCYERFCKPHIFNNHNCKLIDYNCYHCKRKKRGCIKDINRHIKICQHIDDNISPLHIRKYLIYQCKIQ
jgi:hypothetical protein